MKRFSLTYTRSYPPLEHPEGEWVRYQEAKEQQARIDELEQSLERMVEAYEAIGGNPLAGVAENARKAIGVEQ